MKEKNKWSTRRPALPAKLILAGLTLAGILFSAPAVQALSMPDTVVIVELRRATATTTTRESGVIVLWNPTASNINLSGYFLARYGTSNWKSPSNSITADSQFSRLQPVAKSDSIIVSGGFLRIAVPLDTSNVPVKDSDYFWNSGAAFSTGDPFAVGLFPFNPTAAATDSAAQAGRADAVGAGSGATFQVFEGARVPNNLTATLSAIRHRLSINNVTPKYQANNILLFTDTNSNVDDFDTVPGNPPDSAISSLFDTCFPVFVMATPASISLGTAFNLSCTMAVQTKLGIRGESTVTGYSGTNAWCSITVSSGSVSPETTSTLFSSGKWLDSITISGAGSPLTITVRDGAATASTTVTVSNPTAGGTGSIDKTAKVAANGRGTWKITYAASATDTYTNGRVDLRVPSGWGAPQIANPVNAQFTNITVANGTISDSYVIGDTIIVKLSSLTPSTGQLIFEYGYTNGGTNRNALGKVRPTSGSSQFLVSGELTAQDTASLYTITNQHTPLSVVTLTGGDSTLSPSANPQSFINAQYDVTLTVKDSTAAVVHGAYVSADITDSPLPSRNAALAEVSSIANFGTSTTKIIAGYSDATGIFKVNLKDGADTGLNQVTFNIETSTLTSIFRDTTRPPNPVLSEVQWAGSGGNDEWAEIYNPLLDTVVIGNQGDSFHVGDRNGVSSVAGFTEFNNLKIGPHRYIVIAQSTNVPQYTVTKAGISFLDPPSAETITVYRDTVSINEVVDRADTSPTGGNYFAGTSDANRRTMERLWANRSAGDATSWTNGDSIYVIGGVTHNGTPGLPNSGSLYNSTNTPSDTQTNKKSSDPATVTDSVRMTVTLKLNIGDTQPGHAVRFNSSRGAFIDTFTQPGITNEDGIAVGYVVSSTSGTSVISVSYPKGVTKTCTVVFDFDSPANPTLTNPGNPGETSPRPSFRWSASTDTQTGIRDYWFQLDNDSKFLSPEIDSSSVQNIAYIATSDLAVDTYYWRVRARDWAGNLSAPWDSRVLRIDPAAETPLLVVPLVQDFQNTTFVTIQWTFRDYQSTDTQGEYEIQIDSGQIPDWAGLAITVPRTSGAINTYRTSELVKGQWYSVRVRTYDQSGETSPWSDSGGMYILKRLADGIGTDWTSSLPSESGAAIVAGGDYVWSDTQGDERTDATDPDANYDLKTFYATADTYYLYLRFDVSSLTLNTLPLFCMSIDTDHLAADASMNWIGDQTSLGGSSSVGLGRGGLQYSERNIDMSYEGAESAAFVTDTGDWRRPGYRTMYNYWGTANGIIEYAIPREDAGFALNSTIRVTLGTAQNNIAFSTPMAGDNSIGGPANNHDILDNVFPGVGDAWQEDLSDSDIDYFVDIPFDVNGNVTANVAPSAAGVALVAPAEASNITTLNPRLQWTEASDADSGDTITYWLQLSTASTFTPMTQETTVVLSNERTCATNLANNTLYYWRVRARDNHGTVSSGWSSTFTFRTQVRGAIDGSDADWFGTPSTTGHDTVVSQGEFIYTGVTGDERLDGLADSDYDIKQVRFSGDTTYLYILIRSQDVTNTDEIYMGLAIDADQNSADAAMTWLGDDATGNIISRAQAYGETNVAFHNTTAGSSKIEMYEQSGWGGAGWHAPSYGSSDSIFISTGNDLTEAAIDWRNLRPMTLPGKLRFTLVSYDNVVGWANSIDCTGNYGTDDGLDLMTPYSDSGTNAWSRGLSTPRYDSYVTVNFNKTGKANFFPQKPTLSSPADSTTFGDTQASVAMVWMLNDTDGADALDSAVNVQISTNNTFTALVTDTTLRNRATTVTVTLTTGANYFWRVRERDDFDTSAFSDSRFFYIAVPPVTDTTPPAKPTGFACTAVLVGAPAQDTGVRVSWTLNSETDVANYKLYRNSKNDTRAAGMTLVFTGTSSEKIRLDSTVLPNDTAYYYLVAIDSIGNISDTAGGITAPIFTATKYLDSTSFGPKPGSSIQYRIEIINAGWGPADSIVLYDSISASAEYRDTVTTPVGWEFQYCTFAVPNNSYTSDSYVSGVPVTPSQVKFIRWRKLRVTAGEPLAIARFRIILL